MPRDRKKYNEAMRPITKAHRANNRATDNEIKDALGLDSLPATLLRNAWRRGPEAFAATCRALGEAAILYSRLKQSTSEANAGDIRPVQELWDNEAADDAASEER